MSDCGLFMIAVVIITFGRLWEVVQCSIDLGKYGMNRFGSF